MRRVTKWILSILGLYILYCAGGVGLIAVGKLDRFYFLPYWSVKGRNADKSGFEPDGPWLTYASDKLIRRQITASRKLVLDTLAAEAVPTVECYVAETGHRFTIPLRPVAGVEAPEYSEPARMLVISDIEGNFKGFEALLRGNGVIGEDLRWVFGKGHLVLLGDFFDRGVNVTECLWLIYKLEAEAAAAGGKVHFVVGNHERMNLTGHFKYVRRKYRINADTLRWSYDQWYGPQTVLGQWLRTKNVVEKIGSSLLVHGGISPEVAAQHLSLLQINAVAQSYLRKPAADTALTRLERLVNQPPYSPDWYRGIAQREVSEAVLNAILQQYQVSRMIIGHTPVPEIMAMYNGKVLAIDVPHQEHTDAQEPLQALMIEQGQPRVIDSQGRYTVLEAEQ